MAIARSRARLGGAVLAALVAAIAAQLPRAASAEPGRLECQLTRMQTKRGANFEAVSESRSVVVSFDEATKSLVIERDGTSRSLEHVTMTPIAMTGYVDDLSLGIDRSSWSVVLQTFKPDSTSAEFGTCSQSRRLSP